MAEDTASPFYSHRGFFPPSEYQSGLKGLPSSSDGRVEHRHEFDLGRRSRVPILPGSHAIRSFRNRPSALIASEVGRDSDVTCSRGNESFSGGVLGKVMCDGEHGGTSQLEAVSIVTGTAFQKDADTVQSVS